MEIRLRKLKRQNFWVSSLITNCVGRTMWLMLWAEYQEDWEWLSKLGITWIKRDWSLYIIHLYTLTFHIVIMFRVTYIKVIWDNYVLRSIKSWGLLPVWGQRTAMPLYESLGIMKLNDINKYLIARLMYKYCVGMAPQLFLSYFVRNYDVSSYDLRSSNCFHLPIVTSDLGKNGVRYRGPVLFNKLLTECFNHAVPEAVFVKQLKLSIKIGILW